MISIILGRSSNCTALVSPLFIHLIALFYRLVLVTLYFDDAVSFREGLADRLDLSRSLLYLSFREHR
jgi:hypothetical protein